MPPPFIRQVIQRSGRKITVAPSVRLPMKIPMKEKKKRPKILSNQGQTRRLKDPEMTGVAYLAEFFDHKR